MPESDLPFGSEFSPEQICLSTLLELAAELGGDWKAFEGAIHDRYFSDRACSEYNRRKLANNTRLSMIAYGLIERDASLTDLGRELHHLRQNRDAMLERFALHILLELHGLTFVQCIRDIQLAGQRPTLEMIAHRLADFGLYVPDTGRHMSTLRLWLEEAGVFSDGRYHVNDGRLDAIVGMEMDEIDALSMLNAEQRAFLRTLANLDAAEAPFQSNNIEDLASQLYGVSFSRKQMSTQIIHPLEEAGWIRAEKSTTGRGAKPFLISPTEKFVAEVVEPILERVEEQAGARLRPLLRRPMSEIIDELEDEDRHVSGLALEALAFKLMRIVGLDYVGTRVRGEETAGAEVDLIFQSARLVFSRWQVQCKNRPAVSLDDVAKEVGLTHVLRSNVILVVTTGRVTDSARSYANKVMAETNLAIALIDGDDLNDIEDEPTSVGRVLRREAEHAMDIKELDM